MGQLSSSSHYICLLMALNELQQAQNKNDVSIESIKLIKKKKKKPCSLIDLVNILLRKIQFQSEPRLVLESINSIYFLPWCFSKRLLGFHF